jgi:hypothetical protein
LSCDRLAIAAAVLPEKEARFQFSSFFLDKLDSQSCTTA